MILLIIAVCVLSILVVILGFTTFNLLKKQEKAEDILMSYLEYLDNISRTIEMSDKMLKDLDRKGSFKSDDEVGFFFEQIQQIQDILNDFKVVRLKE
jgi:hypothetical protein